MVFIVPSADIYCRLCIYRTRMRKNMVCFMIQFKGALKPVLNQDLRFLSIFAYTCAVQ